MSAAAIAAALGKTYRSATGWWNTRCPVCCGDGKLGLRDGESGLIVHCLKGCLGVDVLAQIDDLDLAGYEDADPGPASHSSDATRALALDIWRSSAAATPTCLVAKYFASRGLDPSQIPPTIREIGIANPYSWHPKAQERRPALVAAITGVDRKIIGVSRTFLAIDGSAKAELKPSRLFTGATKGGAVRLGPIIAAEPLVIGEGIETVLSAMRLWGYSGGWAALSANGLRSVVLPPEAHSILIVVDNDANGVGQAAARGAAWLWEQEGRDVRVALPPVVDTDFNDILRGTI